MGPSRSSKGGISQMMNVLDDSLSLEHNLTFIESYKDGNKISKLIYFILSLLHFLISLLVKNVDVVHINTSSGRSFQRKKIFCRICKFFKVKYIVHIHSGAFIDYYFSLSKVEKSVMESVLTDAASVVAISEHFYLTLKDLFPTICIQLIPNTTSLQPLKCVDVESKFKNRTILYMGRISKDKGFLDACKIYSELNKKITNLKFVVAGVAEDSSIYKCEDYLAVKDKLELKGWVSGGELFKLLSEATVVVCPSYFEAFGLTALEASMYGTPVFGYDVGGLTDVVLHRETGELSQKGNYIELARGIENLLNDKNEYFNYSKSALSYSSCTFSKETYTQKIESLFYSIQMA